MTEKIFYNGIVRTMAGKTCQAVAVDQGMITAVGSNADILALAAPRTEKIDLQGYCLLPGFNDSHCHLLLTGLAMERLDLKGVCSPEEIVARGRKYIEEHKIPPGRWIVGFGFDQNLFARPVLPDGAVAEAISDRHPVLLDRVCGHVGAANSLALQEVGFTPATAIAGGILEKDNTGRLTGIIHEVALDTLKAWIPKSGTAETKRTLQTAMRHVNALGITSVQTDDLEGATLPVILEAYARLEEEGDLTVRIFKEVQAARRPLLDDFLARNMRTCWGNDLFQIGNIKLLTDGSLGARTAYLRQDYSDLPGDRGIAVYHQEELDEMVLTAHQAGMQIAFHAIGDGAVEQCLNAVEKALLVEPRDLRHRLVHCQIVDNYLLDRMLKLHVGADIQPAFIASDWPLVEPRLGADRANGAYNWRTMLQKGIALGGGSDSPVESIDPLWGIYCAVTRQDAAGLPPGGWQPQERLTVEEVVALYTHGAAYMALQEKRKGTIEPGKLADFVVLSRDLMALAPEEILQTKVMMTVVGGRICYQR